ncbi:fasciclin domain-containing protein [Umezakia ovalisporum]|uniref:fasciclin domain-containing protein n=1 Tax=Umezakia ovalisporum TaxID=75695 RepID=UPI0006F06C9E|nr:fasciclin domain-containing protein [Umezakia ovalisporum]MBI1242690.1 fasciclin domain-containing protein [Nostoc sp. RI_552]MDH6084566.1 fasciclin domain-containing protein [Umezakia ovalisporum TAC611]MDH6087840.1 fasciclin domain-containing protein [Umezakia ovalisporum Ak1311]CEJ45787.1 Beta-Ig-H3/fasciclin [Umezakia ovalisporum]
MKANYGKLHTKLARVVGLAGISLLIALPSQANQPKDNLVAQADSRGLNPRPSIFNEPPYNRSPRTAPSATPPDTRTPRATPPKTTPETETQTQKKTLLALAESSPSFTTLTTALKAAGLTDVLQGQNQLTVFAPTDAAFARLPQDAVRDLLKPENKEILLKLLTYHVVSGTVLSTDLSSGTVKSLEGGNIEVKVDANGVMVNDAKVVQADIKGSNGVIHAIDQVILPPDL